LSADAIRGRSQGRAAAPISPGVSATLQPVSAPTGRKVLPIRWIVASIRLPGIIHGPCCLSAGAAGGVQAVHDQSLRARARQMACSRAAHERAAFDLRPLETDGVRNRKRPRFGSRCDEHGYRGHRCRGVLPCNQTEFRKVLATHGRAHKPRRVGDRLTPDVLL
jgi:hypothetical protein